MGESEEGKKRMTSKSEQYETLLGRVNSLILRYGVILSSALILSGIIIAFLNPGTVSLPGTTAQLISANIGKPTLNFGVLLNGVLHLNGLFITQTGILILLATPIIRVAVTTVLFATERDRVYVIVGAFVLLVLLVSVFVIGPIEAGTSS